MRETKIVLIEGMPGTGKSTVAQFVHSRLCENGRPTCWCHEESAAFPVRLFYDRERHLTCSDYCDEATVRWREYVKELKSQTQIAVLDAGVLQNHVRSMLLFDCDRPSILELVGRIENELAPLDPVWIYLKAADVEANFRNIVQVRGQRLLDLWVESQEKFPYASRAHARGLPGFIAFWKEFDQVADRVFDELKAKKLRLIAAAERWNENLYDVCRILEMPPMANRPSAADLERLAGRYVSETRPDGAFTLRVKNGFLILCCDEPTFETHLGPIGCYRETRLVRKGDQRFDVESWPHEVEFSENDTLRLRALEPGWAQADEVYVRQTSTARSPGARG